MRVVIFTDTYPPFINGVSTSCYNLVSTLREHGHQVLVVTPLSEDGPTKEVDGVIYIKGIELKNLYGYRITKLFDRAVFNRIKDFKPDIIHIQTDFSIGQFGYITIKRLKNVASVYTYHTSYEDYTYYITKGLADRVLKKFIRSYAKNVAKNMTEYITPSGKTKEYMRNSGTDAFINVIPTGLDFSIFKDENIDLEKVKEFKIAHDIDEDTKLFLILGRVAKEKSMDVSIEGFANFKKTYPDIKTKLLIVGDGPLIGELQNLVIDLKLEKDVVFVGSVPAKEVPFYYHLADIYTSASLTETQGLTFMEAMASGTPVLARFDSQLEDTIIDNETGFFFSDLDSFTKKAYRILSLTSEEKQELKNKAYQLVDKYSLDKFYSNIIKVYERAIRKKW